MQRRTIDLIVPLGNDLANRGAELGEITKLRDRKAWDVYDNLCRQGKWPRIVVSPGISPNRDEYCLQTRSMAQMMKDQLVAMGIPSEDVEILPLAWGTLGEIVAAAEYARSRPNESFRFHVTTSAGHAFRTFVIARKHLGKGVEYHLTPGTWKDFFKEFLKTPGEILALYFPSTRPFLDRMRGRCG